MAPSYVLIDFLIGAVDYVRRCCGLPPGHDMIEFDKDCKWDNFMTPNFTALHPFAHRSKNWSIEAAKAVHQDWPGLRGNR